MAIRIPIPFVRYKPTGQIGTAIAREVEDMVSSEYKIPRPQMIEIKFPTFKPVWLPVNEIEVLEDK